MDLEIPLVLAVLGSGAYLARRLIASRSADDDARALEAWRQAARRLGGELELRRRSGKIVTNVEGVALVLTATSKLDDGTIDERTTAVAGPLPSAGDIALRVTPRNPITKRLRAGRERTDEATFGDAMQVTASPRALATELLDPPTQRCIENVGARFWIERGKLRIESEGIPLDAEPLIELGRFAEQLIRRWTQLLRGPARVAAALGLDAAPSDLSSSSIVGRGLLRGRALELVIRVDDERALTVVRFEDDGGGEWTLERGDDGAFVPTGDVPEPVRSAAPSQGSALLGLRRVDGFFELAFDGLSPAPSEVTATTFAIIDTSVHAYR